MSTVISATTHRNIASLNLPLPMPEVVTYAQAIVKGMTGNPAFPSPTPPLVQVEAAITTLATAQAATLTRAKGAVATRNTAHAALHTMLQQLKGYVQMVADGKPETGAAIIEGAGMAVQKGARPTASRLRREARTGRRLGEARHLVRRSPRVVRVGVQHRRRQDLGGGAAEPPGQDDRDRPAVGHAGAVQGPRRDQGGTWGLEPHSLPAGEVG